MRKPKNKAPPEEGTAAAKIKELDITKLRIPLEHIGHVRINGQYVVESEFRCADCGRKVWSVAFQPGTRLMGCDCRCLVLPAPLSAAAGGLN